MAFNSLPTMRLVIDVSDRLEDLITQARQWNQHAREAMAEGLSEYHDERIPRHFRQDAREIYDHKERLASYLAKKAKRFHSYRDLVKRGLTEQFVTSARRITLQGSLMSKGAGATLRGNLIMQHAIPVAQDNTHPSHVTIADMKREMTLMTDAEQERFAKNFSHRLATKLETRARGMRRYKTYF